MPLILLSPSSLLSISDGDTPEVKMGVRMPGVVTMISLFIDRHSEHHG